MISGGKYQGKSLRIQQHLAKEIPSIYCPTCLQHKIPLKKSSISLFSQHICRLSVFLNTWRTSVGSIAMRNNDWQIRNQNWGLVKGVGADFWPSFQQGDSKTTKPNHIRPPPHFFTNRIWCPDYCHDFPQGRSLLLLAISISRLSGLELNSDILIRKNV